MIDKPGGDDPSTHSLGQAVHQLRVSQGLSRKDLAEDVGISPDYLSKIERGERTPSEVVLASLAACLDTDAEQLWAETERVVGDVDAGHEAAANGDAAHEQQAGDVTARSRASAPTSRGRPPRPGRRPTGPRGRRGGWADERLDPRVQAIAASAEVAAEADGAALLDLVEWMLTTLRSRELDHAQATELRHLIEMRAGASSFPPAQAERAHELVVALLDSVEGGLDDDQIQQLLDFALYLAREGIHPTAPTSPRVCTVDPGRVHYVWLQAVGIDDDGRLWVNPQASARRLGEDAKDPRIWRFADGRVVVDLSRLADDVQPGARDETRHRIQALAHDRIDGVPVEAYNDTELVIEWPTSRLVVEPAPYGQTHGAFPHGVSQIHVVTAANPHSQLLPPDENAQRNDALRAQLEAQGYRWYHAIGRSRDEPERRWEEPSFAVVDADRDAMVALAREHGQFAIFEWTPTERALVRCQQPDHAEDAVVEPLGWRARWEQPEDARDLAR